MDFQLSESDIQRGKDALKRTVRQIVDLIQEGDAPDEMHVRIDYAFNIDHVTRRYEVSLSVHTDPQISSRG